MHGAHIVLACVLLPTCPLVRGPPIACFLTATQPFSLRTDYLCSKGTPGVGGCPLCWLTIVFACLPCPHRRMLTLPPRARRRDPARRGGSRSWRMQRRRRSRRMTTMSSTSGEAGQYKDSTWAVAVAVQRVVQDRVTRCRRDTTMSCTSGAGGRGAQYTRAAQGRCSTVQYRRYSRGPSGSG